MLKIKKPDNTITLDADFFSHLLNCMANLKYLPMESDEMSAREEECHRVIAKAYQKARRLLYVSLPEEERNPWKSLASDC